MSRKHKHIFGPVPSRRLGRSLGVDLVPFKVCPFDCIYCQLGRTTSKTDLRREYVDAEDALDELRQTLAAAVACDYVTLSGSGEPTLHSGLGRIIAAIKEMTDVPVAILTNGALLGDMQVREDLARADLVVPSLDAGDAETFARINRPCGGIDFDSYVEGLEAFCREFSGRVWLEVFLVAGVNDSEDQVRRIAAIAERLDPDRIEVNTIARPPAEADARAVEPGRLERLCRLLGPKAAVIAPRPAGHYTSGNVGDEDILAMLARRPCTLDDMAEGLSCHRAELTKLLGHLVEQGKICLADQGRKTYYRLATR